MMMLDKLPLAWKELLRSEAKRWGIQFLIMLGAIPYVFALMGIVRLSFEGLVIAVRFAFDINLPDTFFFRAFGFLTIASVFVFYYLISLRLHWKFDRHKSFDRNIFLSIRFYLSFPFIFETLGAWGELIGIPRNIVIWIRDWYGGVSDYSWIFLFFSSVLLTWVLSEWLCRYQAWRRQINKNEPIV